jgi:predicted permease
METLRQDLRFSIRALLKNRGFSAIAILTLALGIGANTALFTVMNAVMLRPLPVKDPQQLVSLTDPESAGMSVGTDDGERGLISYHEFEGLRDQNQVFSGLLAFQSYSSRAPLTLGDAEEGSNAIVSMVSGNYFSLLGVEPRLGRAFGPEVDQGYLAHPVAVVSYSFWQRRLQQNQNVVGLKIHIRKAVFDIVGVMPAGFSGLMVGESPDVWTPLTMQLAVDPGRDYLTQQAGSITKTMFLHVIGRLKPGVDLAKANTSINLTFKQVLEADAAGVASADDRKAMTNSYLVSRNARNGLSTLRGEYQKPLGILMGLVGLLLLLACANVANLLLARAAGRQRELAVRVALGAGRGRLIRQLLTESLMLAAVGGAVGLLLAQWGDRVLLHMVSSEPTPIPLDVHPDLVVLSFSIGVTLLTGLLFGLAPALRATRLDLNQVLRGAARNISGTARGSGRILLGKLLVGVQVAISLLLLVAAGLFVRSLQKLDAIQLGYDPGHMVLFQVAPGLSGYKGPAADQLLEEMLARFSTIPGVTKATLSQNGLFSGSESGDQISFPGYTVKAGLQMGARFDLLGPNYFSTIGIPVVMGRDVLPQDSTGQKHCWMNQTMARYYFGDESPIGRHMRDEYPESRAECEIAGVVADAKYNGLREKTPRRFYFPYFNAMAVNNRFATYEIRYAGDGSTVTAGIRRAFRDKDSSLDVPEIYTISKQIEGRTLSDRLTAKLSTFFGGVALLLACVGLYGILSYNVARRTSEIGVRVALGAQRGTILALILREALIVTLVGIAVGIGASFAATQILYAKYLTSMLYGVSKRDPVTMIGASVVLLVVATLAAAIPALRASRTDPITALRYE